jgi:hypothetical protein
MLPTTHILERRAAAAIIGSTRTRATSIPAATVPAHPAMARVHRGVHALPIATLQIPRAITHAADTQLASLTRVATTATVIRVRLRILARARALAVFEPRAITDALPQLTCAHRGVTSRAALAAVVRIDGQVRAIPIADRWHRGWPHILHWWRHICRRLHILWRRIHIHRGHTHIRAHILRRWHILRRQRHIQRCALIGAREVVSASCKVLFGAHIRWRSHAIICALEVWRGRIEAASRKLQHEHCCQYINGEDVGWRVIHRPKPERSSTVRSLLPSVEVLALRSIRGRSLALPLHHP